MKYKKIIMLTIILAFLLAISAVSAADNATSDVVSVDESINEIVNVEENNQVTEQSENEEIINAADDGTFTALQSKINSAVAGSTITLKNDYRYDEGFSTDGILITKDLTIQGNGHTINGLSKSRIFSLSYDTMKRGITDNFKLTLVNVNFLNGHSMGSGGAIKAISGEVYGSYNNPSDWYHYSWDLDITNCMFNNNKASFSDRSGAGGAIYTQGKLIIKDSTFMNNEAEYSGGGAIYSGNPTYFDTVECSNCIFTNNKADESGGGGALNIYYSAVFNDCTFESNEAASNSGGAIATSGNININRCSFSDNKANDGGAVFTYNKDINICYSTFTSNKASRNGGAVYSNLGQTIKNCEFIANQASNNGGAVYYNGKVTTTSSSSKTTSIYTNMIENSIFKDNAADNTGGAIYCVLNKWDGKTYGGNAEKCTFNNNNAESYNDAYGTTTTNCIFQSGYKLVAYDVVKYYGGSQKYTVTLTNKDGVITNANVKININGKTYSATTNSKGQASVALNLGVGTYEIVSEYNDVKVTSKVNIKSTITASDATGSYSNSKVTATFLNTAGNALSSKQVTFKVGDKTYTATTNSNGVASANIPLGVGTYNVVAVNPTTKEEKQFKLSISKANSKIKITTSQTIEGVFVTATMTPNTATGKVYFKLGQNTIRYVKTIKNGEATFKYSNLNKENYNVTVSYDGDDNLKSSSASISFKVEKIYAVITASDLTKKQGGSEKLTAVLKDNKGNLLSGYDLVFILNGVSKTIKTNSNGRASLDINLAPGKYDATIKYNASGAKSAVSKTVKIVVKEAPVLYADSVSLTYGDHIYFVTCLKDAEGKPIADRVINMGLYGNTQNYAITPDTTDEYGEFIIDCYDLVPDKYVVYINSDGCKEKTAKITVKKATPKITAKAKIFRKSVKTKKYTVTLKTNQNKVMKNTKLTLKVNGKTYSAKTNAKGQATFKITKLTKKGKFTAVVKFAGNKYYNAKTVNTKITVR